MPWTLIWAQAGKLHTFVINLVTARQFDVTNELSYSIHLELAPASLVCARKRLDSYITEGPDYSMK